LRFLQSWAILALFVSAGAAFYELSPSQVRFIDVDAELASRGIYLAPDKLGPSVPDLLQSLGDDPENAINADDDPELRPYFIK
jgi:hypothetical protein